MVLFSEKKEENIEPEEENLSTEQDLGDIAKEELENEKEKKGFFAKAKEKWKNYKEEKEKKKEKDLEEKVDRIVPKLLYNELKKPEKERKFKTNEGLKSYILSREKREPGYIAELEEKEKTAEKKKKLLKIVKQEQEYKQVRQLEQKVSEIKKERMRNTPLGKVTSQLGSSVLQIGEDFNRMQGFQGKKEVVYKTTVENNKIKKVPVGVRTVYPEKAKFAARGTIGNPFNEFSMQRGSNSFFGNAPGVQPPVRQHNNQGQINTGLLGEFSPKIQQNKKQQQNFMKFKI